MTDSQYLTGARIVETLRRAEDIDLDGPGLAAHQVEAILGVDEDEAAEVLRLLAHEGYATEHATENGTPFWRYAEVDEELR